MATVKVYELAQLAKAVYNFQEYETAKLLSTLGYTYVKFYDQGETQAFLAYKEGVRVVCFRGTSFNVLDLIRDINFFLKFLAKKKRSAKGRDGGEPAMVPAAEGEEFVEFKAHAGFVRSLNQIWGYKWGDFGRGKITVEWTDRPKMANDIDPEFKSKAARELVPGDTPIIFTGHSLGAALAALGAFRASVQGVKDIRVVGFGTPRFASVKLKEEFKGHMNFVRYVHASDIINSFPPTPNLRQCGHRISIGRKISLSPVKDHGMQNYVHILRDHIEGRKDVLKDEHRN
jgi:hypothetical protein